VAFDELASSNGYVKQREEIYVRRVESEHSLPELLTEPPCAPMREVVARVFAKTTSRAVCQILCKSWESGSLAGIEILLNFRPRITA
jgi:hypothetical protein